MDGYFADIIQEAMHAAKQQAGDRDFHFIGNCIEYDVETNMGRFLITAYSTEDESGNVTPFETGWTQITVPFAGDGFGWQYYFAGGATPQNPEKGEQVTLSVLNAEIGLFQCDGPTYNDTMKPPGAGNGSDQDGDPNGTNQLKVYELVLRNKAGCFLKFYSTGDVAIYAAQDLNLTAGRDVNIKWGRDFNQTGP